MVNSDRQNGRDFKTRHSDILSGISLGLIVTIASFAYLILRDVREDLIRKIERLEQRIERRIDRLHK